MPVLLVAFLHVRAQQVAGAIPAQPNTVYSAGGSCTFFDAAYQRLLSVDKTEAAWSATPAKATWVVVEPSNGWYIEYPNFTSKPPALNLSQYQQPFWTADTIFNELVLLTGVNSTARLMYEPVKLISVTNYDFSESYIEGQDFSVSAGVVRQLSTRVSAGYLTRPGKNGNGQPNGLINTLPTSWISVTYIPDRSKGAVPIPLGYRGDRLPKTMARLRAGLPLVVQAQGMSITAGMNVSGFAGDTGNFPVTAPYMRGYVELLANAMETRFGSRVTLINGSCPGKDVTWMDRYCEAMIIPNRPDLVILDMGMNDIWGSTSKEKFRNAFLSCIRKIQTANPQTEFILIGNMLPDITAAGSPLNGADLMYGFLGVLKSIETTGIAVFDMTSLSDTIYRRKGARHCTSNALHPNDYLARWYAQGLTAMFQEPGSSAGRGRKFFVNTSGNNTDGLTPETAWRELDKVNKHRFQPSDTILFEGGKTFRGYLEFDSLDGNAAERPIIISSYGAGRATISTTVTTHCGLKATNTQGIWISNLIFKGPGSGVQKDIDGISFFTNRKSGYLSHFRITNCDVGQFGYCGIRFYSDWDSSVRAGFRDVIIDRCRVFDCMENGIVSSAYDKQEYTTYNHKNFIVRNTEVFDIRGYASSSHKGSGIVLSQVDSALIEHCVAYRCGTENTACGGPGGIWVWAANRVTIQFCESHHNSSGKPRT